MNKQIAVTRLKDVLNVDSINTTQADFLATHVPFRKIKVTNDLSGTPTSEYISEDNVFNKYFNNSNMYNEHQLIVVDGSSGSGKSHFIRWIEAKLSTIDFQNDIVLMIRRSDNTLKGTIKQFLNIEEVKNIKNKDIYERLVRANQNVSEQKFKYEIYHKFLVEIADEESILSSSDRKNFRELLSSSEFEERMLMAGGPIERIYSKIVDSNTTIDDDVLALFEIEDFTLDYDFNEKLKYASKKARKMANKLLPELDGSFPDDDCNPEILVKYMNSKVEPVIKACAGLEPGDFQQIFKEIRQELYAQGKNLILLIEDITSCTGINRDLLDALIVKHTGSNEIDKMCRLVSVIGTTTEYFKEFRSNYLDRITTMFTIEDGSIGNNLEDLFQFVAKYLNVMSLNSEVINTWYKDGALEFEYPIHEESEVENWDSYTYLGKKMSLYPFTKIAIKKLYDGIDVHKTPRYIIRKIIEPAVDNIIQDKDMFPKFLLAKKPSLGFEVVDRVKSTVTNMQINEDKTIFTNRLLAFLSYWGDGTLDTRKRGYLGAVSINVYKEFGFASFAEKILGVSIENDFIEIQSDLENTNEPLEIKDEPIELSVPMSETLTSSKKVVNKAFEDFTKILTEWHYDKKTFSTRKAYQARDELCKFIFANIPWQQEGVPLISVQMVERSNYHLVEIERQDKNVDKGLVLLEDIDETYQLLLAIGKSLYLSPGQQASWNFEGAVSSIRVVTSWLEKNKKIFVDLVKAFDGKQKSPDYLRCAMIAEIYRGLLNGDYQVNKVSDIKVDVFIKDNSDRKEQNLIGHSKEWCDLVNKIIYSNDANEQNIDTIQRYFNLIQGNPKNAKKANRMIINYNLLEQVFKELKNNQFTIDIDNVIDDKIKERKNSKDYLKKILCRIDKVASKELSKGKELYDEVLKYFGYSPESEIEKADINDVLNEVIDFYKDTEKYSINIPLKTNDAIKFKEKVNEILKALSIVSEDISNMSTLDVIAAYSSNPIKQIESFVYFLREVDKHRNEVYNQLLSDRERLTRSGNWSGDVDSWFETNKSIFEDLIRLVED